MADPAPDPLSLEELAEIDAAYEAVPSFADWPPNLARAELWDRAKRELDSLKIGALPDATLKAALETAIRAAAFDTGAIEGLYQTDRGLTMTVATQAASWQSELDSRAPDARLYFEAQLRAYELVMDVATHARPVTEVWIREIHEVLTTSQHVYTVHTSVGLQERPLPRGKYKTDPNHVRTAEGDVHAYAPVEATPVEMERLIREVASDEFRDAHPILQASYVHYCIAAIHPFADGNGRVARAISSTYLYRAATIPLLILVDQRLPYLNALEAADSGERRPFVHLVEEAARSALGMVSESLRTASAADPHETVNDLASLLTAQGGLTHQNLDTVAGNLSAEALGLLISSVPDLPPGVRRGQFTGNEGPMPPGFRPVQQGEAQSGRGVTFQSVAPAEWEARAGVRVFVSVSRDDAEAFTVVETTAAPDTDPETLTLALQDAYPELTVAARYRLEMFTQRLVGKALKALTVGVQESLSRSGYRFD